MGIQFDILRHGDKSDRGRNGGYGFVVVGRDLDSSAEAVRSGHAETVHCAETHPHTIDCVKTEMQRKPVVGKNEDGSDRLGDSPKEKIEKWVARQEAEAAKPKVPKAVLPKKTVRERGKDVQVEDTRLVF